MGLFSKLFGLQVACPSCGTSGAKDGFFALKCRNPQCRDYDERYAKQIVAAEQADWYDERPAPSEGSVSRFERSIDVVYNNARGRQKTFYCDADSIERRGDRISLRVAPTSVRISLAPNRIQNITEVEAAIQALQPDFTKTMDVVYQNFRDERRTFRAAAGSVRRRGTFYSLCVEPQRVRISLRNDRILNRDELDRALAEYRPD